MITYSHLLKHAANINIHMFNPLSHSQPHTFLHIRKHTHHAQSTQRQRQTTLNIPMLCTHTTHHTPTHSSITGNMHSKHQKSTHHCPRHTSYPTSPLTLISHNTHPKPIQPPITKHRIFPLAHTTGNPTRTHTHHRKYTTTLYREIPSTPHNKQNIPSSQHTQDRNQSQRSNKKNHPTTQHTQPPGIENPSF